MSGADRAHAHEPWDKPCDATCPGWRPGGRVGANPKLTTCAAELAEDFKRNWARKVTALGAGDPEPPSEVVAATLYSLLYSGIILCPKPEHRIGISLRDTQGGSW